MGNPSGKRRIVSPSPRPRLDPPQRLVGIATGVATPYQQGQPERGNRQSDRRADQPLGAVSPRGLLAQGDRVTHGSPELLAMLVLVEDRHGARPARTVVSTASS